MNLSRYEIARARVHCWERKKPTLLLDKGQQGWVRRFWEGEGNAVWCIGRQRGKSYGALDMACEFALNNDGSIIRYAAKTKDSAKGIVVPTLEQILEWCPTALRPDIDEGGGQVRWSNGSVLTWAGTDAQSFDRLRGPRAHLILLDESAFYQDLERVEAALLPQLTTTQGKALYLSTPPESLAHPFVRRFRSAQANKRAEHESIEDNPRLSKEQLHSILRSFADTHGLSIEDAVKSTFWRREYRAEFVTEENRAALPGYTEKHAETIVQAWERPQFRDHYTSLDMGYHDGHGVLFAYWDFKNAKLVIEDEIVMRSKTTDQLCSEIKQKEIALYGVEAFDGTLLAVKDWTNVPDYVQARVKDTAQKQPYMRIADDNALILADIIERHGIAFLPTRKDDKSAAVDDLDIAIRRNQIVILPNCKNLHKQLLTTVWDKNRREWERAADGHGELVDALVYLWRNVLKNRSPEPEAPLGSWERHIQEVNNPQENVWAQLQRVRR